MLRSCCLCSDTNEANLVESIITEPKLKLLIKNLLTLAGIKLKEGINKYENVCTLCQKDLTNLRNFLLRINVNQRRNLANVSPERQSTALDTRSSPIVNMNDVVPKKTDPADQSDTVGSYLEIDSESFSRKRLRRPPARYRNEDFMSRKVIKISKYPQKIQSSAFNCYPKMAYIRSLAGAIIGDVVEVQQRAKHSRMRILCRQCSEAFSHEKQFRKHLAEHQEIKVNQISNATEKSPYLENERFVYLCTLCEKAFHEHFIVRRHFKNSHNEERPFKCKNCPATFKYKTNLDYHMAKHSNQRAHQCPQCNKKFILRYELQLHLRIHTGEKPFRCQSCSLSFAHRSNLQQHRLTHRKQMGKKFICCQCKVNFKNHLSLKRHKEEYHVTEKEVEFERSTLEVENILKPLSIKEISNVGKNNLQPNKSFQKRKGQNASMSPISLISRKDSKLLQQSMEMPLNYDENGSKIKFTPGVSESKASSSCITLESFHQNPDMIAQRNENFSLCAEPSALLPPPILSAAAEISPLSSITDNTKIICKPLKSPVVTMLPKNFKIIKVPRITNSQTLECDFAQLYSSNPLTTALQSQQPDANTHIQPTLPSYISCRSGNGEVAKALTKDVEKSNTFTSMNLRTDTLAAQNSSLTKNQENPANVQTCVLTTATSIKNLTNINKLNSNSSKYFRNTADGEFSSVNDQIKTKCDDINRNLDFCKDIQLKGCNIKQDGRDLITWKHCNVFPRKLSYLETFQNPILSEIGTNDGIIYTQNTEMPAYLNKNSFKIFPNSEPMTDNNFQHAVEIKTPCNRVPSISSVNMIATLDTEPTYSSNTTLRKTSARLEKSPRSLLKPNINKTDKTIDLNQTTTTDSLNPKPVITKVEILPQINLQQIHNQTPDTNEKSLQPTTPYVIRIPAEYKFQCSKCWKYFKLKCNLNKHMRTHTGEKPYKCNFCPKSYADASNYKKHKMLHTKAADALKIKRPKPAPSPALSTISDPDPDGIEVMQTIQPFELSSSDDSDDMESYIWQNALQHSLVNEEIRENIKRNLMAINKAIMPAKRLNISEKTRNCVDTLNYFSSENPSK